MPLPATSHDCFWWLRIKANSVWGASPRSPLLRGPLVLLMLLRARARPSRGAGRASPAAVSNVSARCVNSPRVPLRCLDALLGSFIHQGAGHVIPKPRIEVRQVERVIEQVIPSVLERPREQLPREVDAQELRVRIDGCSGSWPDLDTYSLGYAANRHW